jgi:UDP-3-O-[3-hydroxymyristoyl] glucosamine N-acyltransferase
MKLSEIAARLGCRLEGDAGIEIEGVAGVEEAGPGQLTFLANPRYRRAAEATRASAIVLGPDAKLSRAPGTAPLAVLRSENIQLDFARAIEFFYEVPKPAAGVHPSAIVAKNAKI